jgi:hypothetical protein
VPVLVDLVPTAPSPPPPPFPSSLPDKDNVYLPLDPQGQGSPREDLISLIVVFVLDALTGWASEVETVSANLNIRDPLTNSIIPVDDDVLNHARRLLRGAYDTRSWAQLILPVLRPFLPPAVNFLLNGAYRTFLYSTQYLADLVDIQGGLYYTTSTLASFRNPLLCSAKEGGRLRI